MCHYFVFKKSEVKNFKIRKSNTYEKNNIISHFYLHKLIIMTKMFTIFPT